ncbi:MAG: YvcK family protein, partial [Rubrobacter sp.]|nr:YvcK family protein [Rubrobacter sp.]
IGEADVVVLSPGSLFTSIIPSLLGAGVREALARFTGPVLYAANVMTQPGETSGFTASDHVRAIARHAGPLITDVLVHRGRLPGEVLGRYAAEGAFPVAVDREELEREGVRVREADLLSGRWETGIRHDPRKLAREVCEAALVRL